MHKSFSSPSSFPSSKNLVIKASTIAALFLSLAASLPAHAQESMGQMIDDTGLVITSNTDGSLKEFQIQNHDLSAIKITQPATFAVGPVLREAANASLSAKYPTGSLIARQGS